ADPKDQEEFGPKMPATPFHHIALAVDADTQAALEARIAAAGIKPPATYVLEHGYCRSVYVSDPNGLTLEFTRDHPDAAKINRDRRADAHAELRRWLKGDHTSNNTYRRSTPSGMPRNNHPNPPTPCRNLPPSHAGVRRA